MLGSNKGTMYLNMKSSFESEKYLIIVPANLIITYCNFRMGNHNLLVEAGGWEKPKIDFEKRLCNLCRNHIGDKHHFLLVYPLLKLYETNISLNISQNFQTLINFDYF